MCAAVSFGGTWPAGKIAAEHVTPAAAGLARFAIASALLLAIARFRKAPIVGLTRSDVPVVVGLAATAVFAYSLCFFYGVRLASAADGSILVPGVIPLVTVAFAWPFLGERPTARVLAGLAIALTGLILVVDPAGAVDGRRMVGDVVLLGAAVAWAGYTLLGRSPRNTLDPVVANTYTSIIGSLMLLPLAASGGGLAGLARASWDAWAAIAYLALFGTVVGFVLFYAGVRAIGAAKASSFILLVPIIGLLSSVVILHEQIRPLLGVGGVIVVIGLVLAQSSPRSVAMAPSSSFR